MRDIEELKKDADALQIKYRSDIKGETLQARIDSHIEGNKPKPKEPSKPCMFKNTGKKNVFTEVGRCMPGETVELAEDLAEKYTCLEKV